MKTGFYVIGYLKGFKTDSFVNRETGEVKPRHSIGVQLQKPDGFGGYNSETQIVKVDPNCVNEALTNLVHKLKDKLVMLYITPREWVMDDGRKGITYNFDSNSSIEAVEA